MIVDNTITRVYFTILFPFPIPFLHRTSFFFFFHFRSQIRDAPITFTFFSLHSFHHQDTMRASLGGLLVALGWLTFAQAEHNVMVDHSETSQLTYLPASAWVEVELEAVVRAICSFYASTANRWHLAPQDSTVDHHNRTAAMASTPGAQVSLEFEGALIPQ